MHVEEMYIGPFPFYCFFISTSPPAVTSHNIMSFSIIFVSERGRSQNKFLRLVILPLDMFQVAWHFIVL